MRKLSLASFVLLALVACALFFLFAQVVHADGPHGGHPPVVSNGQGNPDKGNDPVPHVNYGLHKGQEKKNPDPEKTPVPAVKPIVPVIVPVPQPIPPIIIPIKEPDKKEDKDWSLYPVCQTGLILATSLSNPDGAHGLCSYGWYDQDKSPVILPQIDFRQIEMWRFRTYTGR